MRPELEEIKTIEEYLLNKLTKEERQDFEQKMIDDIELAHKVELQRVLIQRVRRIGIKYTVATTHKSFMRRENLLYKRGPNKKFFLRFFSLSLILIIAYLIWENEFEHSKTTNLQNIDTTIQTTNNKEVPNQSINIEAERGAFLNFENGTSLIVPANAFIDKDNNPVNGTITIKMREISRDASNRATSIQSSSSESEMMIEITAIQQDRELKLAEKKQLKLLLVPLQINGHFDVYWWDRITETWLKKGQYKTLEYSKQVVDEKLTTILMELYDVENPLLDINIFGEKEKCLEKLDNQLKQKKFQVYFSTIQIDKIGMWKLTEKKDSQMIWDKK